MFTVFYSALVLLALLCHVLGIFFLLFIVWEGLVIKAVFRLSQVGETEERLEAPGHTKVQRHWPDVSALWTTLAPSVEHTRIRSSREFSTTYHLTITSYSGGGTYRPL